MGSDMIPVDSLTAMQVEVGDNIRFSDWNGFTREGQVKTVDDNGDTFIIGIDDLEGGVETFEISADAAIELMMYSQIAV